jgi:hypothetical protein
VAVLVWGVASSRVAVRSTWYEVRKYEVRKYEVLPLPYPGILVQITTAPHVYVFGRGWNSIGSEEIPG